MKRGVFLLILNFINKNEEKERIKKRFFKNSRVLNKNDLNRYSVCVNGKNVIVLELTERDLTRDDVLKLLKIYQGRVLVSEKYKNYEPLKEYLFSSKEYYQRALISSLVNQIKTVNKEWKNICIKTENFVPFKELYELMRISKKIVIIAKNNCFTEKFSKDCYYEYGAIVSVKNGISGLEYDVFLDLDEVDNSGKLMIKVNHKDFILYPDMRYFENCREYQKLLSFNIEYNIICSAFPTK